MRASIREAIYNVEPPQPIQGNTEKKPRRKGPRAYFSRAERRQRVFYDAFLTCFRSWEEITATIGSAHGTSYNGSGGYAQYAPVNPLTFKLCDFKIDFEKCCLAALSKIEHDSHIRPLLNGRTDLNCLSAPTLLAFERIGQLCMMRGVYPPSRYLGSHPDNRASWATAAPAAGGEPITRGKRVSERNPSALGDRATWNVGTSDADERARRVRVPRGFQLEPLQVEEHIKRY